MKSFNDAIWLFLEVIAMGGFMLFLGMTFIVGIVALPISFLFLWLFVWANEKIR